MIFCDLFKKDIEATSEKLICVTSYSVPPLPPPTSYKLEGIMQGHDFVVTERGQGTNCTRVSGSNGSINTQCFKVWGPHKVNKE